MSFFHKISVKSKITLIIVGITIFTVGLTMAFLVVTQHYALKNEYGSGVQQDFRVISEYFVMPITFGSKDRANEIVLNVMSNPNILCLKVAKNNNEIFGYKCRDNLDMADFDFSFEGETNFEGNYLFLKEAVKRDEVTHGYIQVVYFTGLKDRIKKNILFSILVFGFIIAISSFLALYFQRYISKPILELANIASKISKTKDYKVSITKTSNDEVGILMESFNQMLLAIQEKEAERDEITMAYANSEEKLRNIFNLGLDGILLTDLNGYISEISEKACLILGYSSEDLSNRRLADFMPAGYENQRVKVVEQLKKKGESNFYTKYLKKDNREIYLEFSSRLIKIEGKSLCLSYIRDITEKLIAEEALKESEERYKKLVEHFPSAIALHRKNEIIFVNEAIKGILGGKSKQDFHGRNICNFISPESTHSINNQFEFVIKNDQPSAIEEVKMERLDGKPIDAEIISIPLIFSRKKSILSVFNDISRRKIIENELILARDSAEQSDKLKSAFLANMSHEIRTPMNGIIGFADLLAKEDLKTQDIKRYVNIIKTSADRLLSIINDIIDISKIESGAINVLESEFELNALLSELYNFFKHSAEKKGLPLFLNLQEPKEVILKTDRNKVNQIITNLLSNSIKFTTKGKIEISNTINEDTREVVICVKDTGVGIPKSQQEEIFERFRQAKNYIQDFTEGTGLGLSISKGFATALGGKILLESDEDKGAAFSLILPYQSVSKVSEILQKESSEGGDDLPKLNLANKTILVAEDEENNYRYIEELLEPTKVDIIWVRNGLSAVQSVIEQSAPDLILMDIKLPVMNGYTAAKRIKTINASIPIIAQTAYGLEEEREKIVNGGCDDYLSKPISEKRFFELIKKYILNNKS